MNVIISNGDFYDMILFEQVPKIAIVGSLFIYSHSRLLLFMKPIIRKNYFAVFNYCRFKKSKKEISNYHDII